MPETEAKSPNPQDIVEAAVASIGATATMAQYAAAALLVAGVESGAIDRERVFSLLGTVARNFEASAGANSETAKLTALILRGVEETYVELTTPPAGAARA